MHNNLKNPVDYLISDLNHIIRQIKNCSDRERKRLNACLLVNDIQIKLTLKRKDVPQGEKDYLRTKSIILLKLI